MMRASSVESALMAVWRLSRPWVWLSAILLCVASQAAGTRPQESGSLATSGLVLLLIVSAAFGLNDYWDRAIDAVIHPDRAIPRNLLSPRFVLIMSLSTLAAGLLVAYMKQPDVLLYVLLASLLVTVYSPLKNLHGLLGNAVVAFLVALVVPYSSASVALPALALAGMVFLAVLSRELVKDIDDMSGDTGWRWTVPMAIGVRRTYRYAAMVQVAGLGSLVVALASLGYYVALVMVSPVIWWNVKTAKDYWFAAEEDAHAFVLRSRIGMMIVALVIAVVRV